MSGNLAARAESVRRKLGVPALGLALVDRDGSHEVAVAGVRRRGSQEAAQPADRWHIGSCGKSMTAALYARLVERGDAEWGAPLPDLFPDLDGHVDPAWASVTIDDVLLHRAGLPANLDTAAMDAAYTDPRPADEQRAAVAAGALARGPDRVGTFEYSNLGYVLVGAAIERLTGTPVEQAYQEHVLGPLGITSGGWGPPGELAGHRGRVVVRQITIGHGPPVDDVRADNPPVLTPAGRLHVCLDDWCRFLQVFLDAEHPFLTRGTVERLLTIPSGPGARQSMGWAAAEGLPGVGLGQQGSNMHWVATALLDTDRQRAVAVVTNDGRTRLLRSTPLAAAQLLRDQ